VARRLVKERRALEDLAHQVDYYVELELFTAADDFISAFEHFCELVTEQPEMAHLFEAESRRLRELELRTWSSTT
jgi:plasmid stabilization system protein ParE